MPSHEEFCHAHCCWANYASADVMALSSMDGVAVLGESSIPHANGTSQHIPSHFLASDGARRTMSMTGSDAVGPLTCKLVGTQLLTKAHVVLRSDGVQARHAQRFSLCILLHPLH